MNEIPLMVYLLHRMLPIDNLTDGRHGNLNICHHLVNKQTDRWIDIAALINSPSLFAISLPILNPS